MEKTIDELITRYPELCNLQEQIQKTVQLIVSAYKTEGKLLICGNGGSSSDADHIVGELMKSFEKVRPLNEKVKRKLIDTSADLGDFLAANLQQGIPAISLSSNTALASAISNDMGAELVFAQQVVSLGVSGDIFIGISTSGNSKNVINAMLVAKALGIYTIGFTGETGGKLKQFCDILINVPEKNTASVQELHLPIYHAICRAVEQILFQ